MFRSARRASRTRGTRRRSAAKSPLRPAVLIVVFALVGAVLATSAVPAAATVRRPVRPAHLAGRLHGPPARVALRWWRSSDARAYRVFRNGRLLASHVRWAHFADRSVVPGRTYFYRVEACNPARGCSSLSAGIRVRAPRAAPRAAAWIRASRSRTGVLVDWPASSRATKYRLLRDGRLYARHLSRTQASVSLARARGHTFSTRACNALGCSARSTAVTVTGPTPASPTGVRAVAESTTQVAISWNASLRATDYRLYRDGNLVQSAITSTSTVDAPVAPATQYVYYLRACKGDRCSAPSDSVVVNTPGGGSPPPPPKPGGISADSTTETQVGMSWAPVPGATEYHVFRQGIFLASVTQPSYVDTSVAPGTLYFYMVRACASDACSFPSAPTVVKTPSPPLTCSGVSVSPTPDLQAVINSKPTGTTFCLSSGTYPISGAGVLVRANDTLIGQPGTVLDGGGSATTGLYGYGTDTGQNNVTIKGLILRNFASKALRTGWGWTIQGNEISNSQVGVSLGTGSVLRGNYIHDNFQYGVAGGWGNNMLIEGNDIAHNNTSLDCGGTCVADAGGSKIIGASTGTYGLVWRGNWVHDNFGPGIWSDIDVRQVLYENNLVENNTGAGIFQEISWNGTIRYNVARDNATDYVGKSCAYAGQIHVNNAAHVAIYGNTVSAPGGANGICAVDMARTDPSYCPTHLADISVHDNTLEVTARSLSGFVSTRGTAPDQVSFDRDTFYVTDTTGGHWNWNWGRKSWAELHAMSEELQGSLTLVS